MRTDPSSSPGSNRWPHAPGRTLLVPMALLILLAACSTAMRQDVVGSVPDDYRVNHPIMIDEQLQTMDVPVGLDTARLTSPVKGNIAGFARRFNASGSALMAIVVPVGSPNEVVATGLSHQIRDVLVQAGVGPNEIDFRAYSAGPKETGAPIRLAYSKIAAHVEGCGAWPDRLERNSNNRNFSNYGCATQANLAAMIDNPLDLVYPRDMAPADAGRRSTVLEKYRVGDRYVSSQRLDEGEIVQGVGN